NRGLPGQLTLAKLRDPNPNPGTPTPTPTPTPTSHDRPSFTIEQVLSWARAHHTTTGRWPTRSSGRIPGTSGERWADIDPALRLGRHSLPAGLTLAKLLRQKLDATVPSVRPKLTIEQVLAWADAHHAAHGRWPSVISGPIPDAPGENW